MNRILCSALALSLSLFVVQCSQFSSVDPSANVGTKSVKVAIRVPAAFDTIVAKAVAVVSGSDMETITSTLGVDGDTLLTGLINNIPVGSNRFFEVFVYGYNGEKEYYGCANADISSRDTTYVTIVLRKPYGTAVINGYIEEYNPFPDSGHLSPVTIPYIVRYWEDTTNLYDAMTSENSRAGSAGLAVEFATTPVYSIVALDTIFYSWAIASQSVDTIYQNVLTGAPSLVHMFYEDGRYMVKVKASCLLHAYGKASEPLYFTIRNGKVYSGNDTIPQPVDTEPPIITIPWNNPVTIGKLDTLDYSAVMAFDANDGDLSRKIVVNDDIIYGVPGTYTIVFTVSDAAGNTASAKLTVKITRRQHENY